MFIEESNGNDVCNDIYSLFVFQMRSESAVQAYYRAQLERIRSGQLWQEHQMQEQRERVQDEQESDWVCFISFVVSM